MKKDSITKVYKYKTKIIIPNLLFKINPVAPVMPSTPNFRPTPKPATNSALSKISNLINFRSAMNKSKEVQQAKMVKNVFGKITKMPPKKAEGRKPGLGKASAKPHKLAADFLLYGGSHGHNDRVKGSTGGFDKIRRVQMGNPRLPVGLEGVKVSLNTRTGGFMFGKVNAVSVTRINIFDEPEQEEETPENKKERLLIRAHQKSDFDIFFICCYVDAGRTIIQLEDLKTKEVLDTCVIEGYRGSPGVSHLRPFSSNKVVGVFAQHMIMLEIANKKFKPIIFFNIQGINCLDVLDNTDKVSLLFNNNSVEVGMIDGDNTWYTEDEFNPSIPKPK